MQKIINGLAVFSGVVSLSLTGICLVAYLQRDKITNSIQDKVLESVIELLPKVINKQVPALPKSTGSVISLPNL